MRHTSQKTSLQLLQLPSETTSVQRSPPSPFRLLARHFAKQILSLGAEGDEPEIGVTGILAILAVPGVFYSLLLFDKYSTFLRMLRGGPSHIDVYRDSVPDKYLFVVCSMALTAIIVAIKWDRVLPGSLDHSVLAPLPIRLRTIFLSNAAALGFIAAIFAIDLNAVPTVLFPVVVLSDKSLGLTTTVQYILVHGACVVLASAFAFSTCLGLLGALMSLLPPAIFRRASLFVRLGIVFVSFLLLSTVSWVPALMRSQSPATSILNWLPPAWYVALYQCMQGYGTPVLRRLAAIGLSVEALALCVALGSMILSYRRHFMRVPESTGASRLAGSSSGAWSVFMRRLMNRLVLRSGFDRAFYWFALRVLLRSEAHFIAVGAFLTLGLVIASGHLAANSGSIVQDMISGSLSVLYLVLMGFRMTLTIPAGVKSAWIYSMCSTRPDPRPVLRKLAITILLFVVVIPAACIVAFHGGWELAFFHALYLLAVGALLSGCVLMNFRTIPFTSGLPNFQSRTILLIALNALAFLAFTALGAGLEMLMLRHRLSFLAVPAVLALWHGILRRTEKQDASTDHLEMSDGDLVIQTLALD